MKTNNLKKFMFVVVALLSGTFFGCNSNIGEIDAEFMARVDILESRANNIEDPELKKTIMEDYQTILEMIESNYPYNEINDLLKSTEILIQDYDESAIPQNMIDEKDLYFLMLEIIPDNVDIKWVVWNKLTLANNAISTRDKIELANLLGQSKTLLDNYFDFQNMSYDQQIRTQKLYDSVYDIKKKENYDLLVIQLNELKSTHISSIESKLVESESLLDQILTSEIDFVPSTNELNSLKDFIISKNNLVKPSYKSTVNNALNATGDDSIVYQNLLSIYKDLDDIIFSDSVPNKSDMYMMLSSTKTEILNSIKFIRDSYTPLYIQAENFYLDNKLAESYEYILYLNKYIELGTIAPAFNSSPKGVLTSRIAVIAEFLPLLSGTDFIRYSVGIERAQAMLENSNNSDCDIFLGTLELGLLNLGFDVPYHKLTWLSGIDYMAYSPEQLPYSQGWHTPLHIYMNAAYDTESVQDIDNLNNYVKSLIAGLGEMAGMPQERNRYWSGYNTEQVYVSSDLDQYLYQIDFSNIGNSMTVEMLPYLSLGKATPNATTLTQTLRTSVHLTYYALTALKMYENDPQNQEIYNLNLNNLKIGVNNWIMLQEFAGNGVFPFPDVSSVGGSVGNTCKALIEAGIPTKSSPELGRWIIEDYFSDGGMQYDNGLVVGALYYVWDYFKDKDVEFANKIKNSIIWNADTYLLNHNLVKNYNYNSFTVEALSYAYALTEDDRYLEDAIKRFKYGVINGMITEGRMIGRWFDNHNAKMVYQTILVRGSGTLLKFCPKDHPYYNTLKELTGMAYQGVFNEIILFGSSPDGSYFESLLVEMLNLYPASFGWTEDYITTMNIITNAFMQRDYYGTTEFERCSLYASPLWFYIQNLKEIEND